MGNEQRQTLLRSIGTLIISLLIIGLVVWFIFFRDRGGQQSDAAKTTPSAQQQAQKPLEKTQSLQARDSSVAANKNASAANPSNAAPQPSQLVNVGPGNMGALFGGSALIAGSAHALVRARTRRQRTISARKG